MTSFSQRGAAARVLMMIVAAVAVVVAVFGIWLILGPGPMDFAGGKRVTLSATDKGPAGVPAELANATPIQRGEYLARAADCEACHTSENGRPFAGGRAFVLPFGSMYSTNITPDKQTGIGNYSDADFLRAMHRGIARDGTRLYPSMPYASYTYMTDADALAIKAYLFSLPAVSVPRPVNTLAFPFNQRWLMALWSAFFNPDRRFEPNSARSAQWNRGAYLAEAMGHCGECHTPRTLAFSLDNRRKFGGAKQAGWRAYNISTDKETGIGDWSPEQIGGYIAAGHADGRGAAGGPMGEAVNFSLRYLTPNDISALVAYVTTVPPVTSRDLPAMRESTAPPLQSDGATASAADPRGKEIYAGVCAGCHGWTGISPVINYASLTGVRAVNDPTATNIVQVVLSGSALHSPHANVYMPAFGEAYSDVEVAAVANFVTARFGAKPSSITAANVADMRKEISK